MSTPEAYARSVKEAIQALREQHPQIDGFALVIQQGNTTRLIKGAHPDRDGVQPELVAGSILSNYAREVGGSPHALAEKAAEVAEHERVAFGREFDPDVRTDGGTSTGGGERCETCGEPKQNHPIYDDFGGLACAGNATWHRSLSRDFDRDIVTDGGTSTGRSERLRYLTNGELREEIAYAAGADPTRYGAGKSGVGLKKADVLRIATQIQPDDSDVELNKLDLKGLYQVVCRWSGGEYKPNAGNAWKINRDNLKKMHQAIGGRPPREIVAADGGSEPPDNSDTETDRDVVTNGGHQLGDDEIPCPECAEPKPTHEPCRRCGFDPYATDGGEKLPVGVVPPGNVDVVEWAENLELGETIRFSTPTQTLEAELLGFSSWDQYRGQPVIRPPDEIIPDGTPHLLALREEDLVQEDSDDEQELVTDGGTVQACPECDATEISVRTGRMVGSRAPTWHCPICGADFDEPERRPTRSPGGSASRPGGTTAAALADMDPDDLRTDGGPPAGGSEQSILVKLTREKWDVVLHVLEEELAQSVPPEGDWLGEYPGEDAAVIVGEIHEKIARSLHTDTDHSTGSDY
ncbi:MAG: hypothetical protein U5J98_06820 [Halobacteriales archaeon]|nr:hypothetical protein [Halobacteriales archaeon]